MLRFLPGLPPTTEPLPTTPPTAGTEGDTKTMMSFPLCEYQSGFTKLLSHIFINLEFCCFCLGYRLFSTRN